VLWVADTTPSWFTSDDVALIEALAGLAALAIERARLVRREQDAAVLEERARLARDLHDSVTQSIFSLGMLARAAKVQHERGAASLGDTLDRVEQLARQSLAEMRALLFELRPGMLTEQGLGPALEQLTASYRSRYDLPVTFLGGDPIRLADETETAVFRIAQEALNNAVKHAGATDVQVEHAFDGHAVTVEVVDNGRGFALDDEGGRRSEGGMGLQAMRERAASVGLSLHIESTLGKGTRIRITATAATDLSLARATVSM
jgi:signal transduction histidine kinase